VCILSPPLGPVTGLAGLFWVYRSTFIQPHLGLITVMQLHEKLIRSVHFLASWNLVYQHRRRRSSVNFRGHKIFAGKMCIKNQQNARILPVHDMPKFYRILARKIIKILKFLLYLPEIFTRFRNFTWFLPENAQILDNNCPKNIMSRFFSGGAHIPLSRLLGLFVNGVYPGQFWKTMCMNPVYCSTLTGLVVYWG